MKKRVLLIAEKPDLMRKVKAVYDSEGFVDDIEFTSFAGHTMTLKGPEDYTEDWKLWDTKFLPMIPKKFEYKPSPDKLKMYNEIKNKIAKGNYDYLINCCDPGREGNAIFHSFYQNIKCKLPVKRMWHSDLTNKELSRALNNLRDDLKDPALVNLTYASLLRADFDWLVGMNFTRAFSIIGHKKANLGRVMTPTLKIIVDRELEIRNFVPQKFFEIEGDFEEFKGIHFYEKDGETLTRFLNKKDAESVIKKLGKIGTIDSLDEKKEIKYAPNLHALSDLQIECSKAFGYTPADTLKIAQTLYEKQILSYPRTDSPFLTEGTAIDKDKGFKNMFLNSVASVPSLKVYADKYGKDTTAITKMSKNKKYVDDKKVSDHYAIVPTGEKVDLTKLSKEERNVFETVCKRLISIFMPPISMNKTTLIVDVNNLKFKANGSVVLDKGFSELYGTSFAANLLPKLKKGDKVNLVGTNLLEKTTTPPVRYNDATLLGAMKNPSKFIEDDDLKSVLKEAKGIGTEATRAGILEKLVDVKMMERNKKNVVPTEFGISIIINLGDNKVASPELTGIWEEKLKNVENSKLKPMDFYKEMIAYIEENTKEMLKMSFILDSDIEILGTCPKCGKSVKEGKEYYLCVGYKKDCDFIIGKTFLGAKISKTEVKKLLTGKATKEFSFKKGEKTWKAKLIFNKTEGKISFDNGSGNSEGPKAEDSKLVCPKCGKPLKGSNKYYMCSSYKSGCDFLLTKELSGTKISESDFEKLAKGETIKKKFTWKSGKSSETNLKLENWSYKFLF